MAEPVADDPSADLRGRVVAVAADLLKTGGIRAVTTRAVAAAAGIPAPTIYRLFGDKDGLMLAVAERAMASYSAQEAARVETGDLDPVQELRSAWHAHIDFGLGNPDLYALILGPHPLQHSAATTAGIVVLTARVERLAASGRLRVPVPQAVRMIHAAGVGVVLTLLGEPVDARDLSLSPATLEAVLTSLLTTRPAPAADDERALIIAFTAALPRMRSLSDAERTLLSEWLHRMAAAPASTRPGPDELSSIEEDLGAGA